MSTQGYLPVETPVRMLALEIDGRSVKVREGSTILDACKRAAIETPTLCYAPNLTPVNACRVCVVELEGARVLVPACARKAEAGMKVKTDTDRVRHSRKLVLEFLASSVDLSTASGKTHEWIEKYEADPARFGAELVLDRGVDRGGDGRGERDIGGRDDGAVLGAGEGRDEGGGERQAA